MNIKEIIFRIRSNIKIKLLLSFILTFGIFSLYLFIQRHTFFPITILRLTALDIAIPFIPDFVYLYESICFLMPIAPWLMTSKEELLRYTLGILFITFVCFTFYIFFPTSIIRPEIYKDVNFLYLILIKYVNEMNAFPSFHVALSIFHGLCCHIIFNENRINKRIRTIIWMWIAGIIVSTLITKQHIIYDIFGGIIAGISGFLIFNFKKIFLPELLNTANINENIIAIKDLFVNFYVIKTSKGLICIDTGWRESIVKKEFNRLKLDSNKVIAVLLTHSHKDHSNCCHLYPNATIYAKKFNSSRMYKNVYDGETINIADNIIDVIETPGHSKCSISYLLNNRLLFSGDTIRLKNNKVHSFYYLLNNNNKTLCTSIYKLSQIKGVEYILTAHHGITNNVKKAFGDL